MNRLFEIDENKEEFNIPESATIELTVSPVLPYDLHFIKYTDDFQSFVDVSLISTIIFISTEIYMAFFQPKDEINLSLVWCGMIIIYGIATLASTARNYLKTPEAGLIIMSAGISFIVSLLIQLADTTFFNFQLKDAFTNISSNALSLIQNQFKIDENVVEKMAKTFKKNQNFYSKFNSYTTNDLLFTCFIASVSAIFGALLFFPAFRLAKLHLLSLKHSQESKLKKLILHLSFFFPILISVCWIKTNRNENLVNKTANISTIQKFINLLDHENINSNTISYSIKIFFLNIIFSENLKIYLVLFLFILRLALFRYYMQSYLNLAYELATSTRKQSTKVNSKKFISSISSIYQYYGVVATHYIIPLYILLFMVFLLKTLGNYSWCGKMEFCNNFVQMISNWCSSLKQNSTFSSNFFKRLESTHFNVSQSHDALNQILTQDSLRSIIGYFTFWTNTILFSISCLGLFYYNYIDNQNVL